MGFPMDFPLEIPPKVPLERQVGLRLAVNPVSLEPVVDVLELLGSVLEAGMGKG